MLSYFIFSVTSDDDSETVPNLKKVLDLIQDVEYSWFNLGIQLDIGMERLKEIGTGYHSFGYRHDRRDSNMCFHEMLCEWLSTSPTWEELATALEQDSVGYGDKAKEIRRLFNIVEKPSVSSEYALVMREAAETQFCVTKLCALTPISLC